MYMYMYELFLHCGAKGGGGGGGGREKCAVLSLVVNCHSVDCFKPTSLLP